MGWRDRLLNATPETVGRAMKFGGGRILSQQDLPRAGMNKGGRAAKQIGGRANLLEEVGRIDAERMNPNRRAEKSRVIGELNRGYNKGGRIGAKKGKLIGMRSEEGKSADKKLAAAKQLERLKAGASGRKTNWRKGPVYHTSGGSKGSGTISKKATGGRIGLKKGGDDKWIQKVDASIKRRGTKGKCTPITKPGCTGRAKALAKTFKKMAAKRKAS